MERQPIENLVVHPQHYNKGGIEVLDIIKAFNLSFNLGNAIKYILRCEYKENKEADLRKAIYYTEDYIKDLKAAIKEIEAELERG